MIQIAVTLPSRIDEYLGGAGVFSGGGKGDGAPSIGGGGESGGEGFIGEGGHFHCSLPSFRTSLKAFRP